MDEERETMKEILNKELHDKQWLTRLARDVQKEEFEDRRSRLGSMLTTEDIDRSRGPRHDTILSNEIEGLVDIKPIHRRDGRNAHPDLIIEELSEVDSQYRPKSHQESLLSNTMKQN